MADSSEEYFTVNCNACEREGEFKKAADYCRACLEYMCRDCLKSHNRLAMTKDHKDKLIGSQPFIDMTKSRLGLPSTISSGDAIYCCHGCANDGDYKEAADYCRECAEYFCNVCLKYHNRWRGHDDKLFGKEEMRKMIDARKSLPNTQSGTQVPSTGSSSVDAVGGARPKTKSQPVASSSKADKEGGSRPKAKSQPLASSSKADKVGRSRSTVCVDSCENPRIRVSKYEKTCGALGSCRLDDGGCLLTDWYNKRLKRLDGRFSMVGWVDLPGGPLAVCSNSTHAAVSMAHSETIAIVSLDGEMRIERKIQVGGWCGGVAWHRGQLLCCVIEAGDNCVLVRYGENDQEIGRTVLRDEEGRNVNSGYPYQIAVCGGRVYVAVEREGLLILDGERFHTVKVVKDFEWTPGVCVGEAGDVFVCGREPAGPGMSEGPGTVKQYNKDGEFINTIISEEQLKQREPWSLSYIRERSILVVTLSNSDEICAFFLK